MKRSALLGLAALLGCSAPAAPGPSCPAGTDAIGDVCVPHFDECGDAALPVVGGGCRALGVPADACGVGMTGDGHGGCSVIEPATACPLGALALPGETACRPVAACGPGTWGTLPSGPVVHVDATYSGGGSTGAEDRPFSTLDAALSAAPTGAVIALAAGTYTGNFVAPRAVRLHGRCPAEVALLPADPTRPVLELDATSEVASLSARGAIRIGAKVRDVVLDQLWVHDTPGDAVQLVPGASVLVRRTLIERSAGGGVLAVDADAVVEDSAIRDALAGTAPASGQVLTGVGAGTLTVRRSLLERFRGLGIRADQSQLTLEDSVVRDATAETPRGSGAIDVNGGSATLPYKPFVVRRSIVAGTRGGAAIHLGLAAATLEHLTLRGARGDQGAVLANRAQLSIVASAIVDVQASGVWSYESEVSLRDVVVRGVGPATDGSYGYGIGGFGSASRTASLRVEGALVRGCRFAGVFVNGATATLADLFVDDVAARGDDAFGDGVSVSAVRADSGLVPGLASLTGVRVRGAARAAVSAFASQVAVAATMLQCNKFDLDGETAFVDAFGRSGDGPYGFADGGAVTCVCGTTVHACVGRESKLAPLPPPAPP